MIYKYITAAALLIGTYAASPTSGIVLQFQNAGTVLMTRGGGLIVFNCTPANTCSLSGSTITLATGAALSGDANHSATVTIGSGTSISATSLCSTTFCGAGTYEVKAYLDITTACTTTGAYIVWLGYTDDSGARAGSATTTFIPLQGTGTTTSTGSVALASTSNYGQGTFMLRSTGASAINYGTTATACGTGGPAVGKLYLSVLQVQ